MKLIGSGYSNDATFRENLVRIIKKKEFAFIFFRIYSTNIPGTLGGNFEWKIWGTDTINELFDNTKHGVKDFTIHERGRGMLEREAVAKLYLNSLSPEERMGIQEKMLIDHLLKK